MIKLYFVEGFLCKNIRKNIKNLHKKLLAQTNNVKIITNEESGLKYNGLSFLTKQRYDFILLKIREMWRKSDTELTFLDLCNEINKNTRVMEEYYIVDYKNIKLPQSFNEAISLFEKYEIGKGNISINGFTDALRHLLSDFIDRIKSESRIYIIEGNFLRDVILDLRIYYMKNEHEIASIFNNFIKYTRFSDFKVIYETNMLSRLDRTEINKIANSDMNDILLTYKTNKDISNKSSTNNEDIIKELDELVRNVLKESEIKYELTEG